MDTPSPRVAILGFHLEANAFAPPSQKADFTNQCWEAGDDINTMARGVSRLPSEVSGFYERMDATGPWTPLPLIVIAAPPGGPADAAVFAEFCHAVRTRLQAVLPVDAVYVNNHGASSAVGDDDSEATLLNEIRALVGPDVPIVVTNDLHCNVSQATVDALDAFVAYRTNPHVDQRERAAEAADLLREILGGTRMVTAHIRLPLTPPSVTLLTSEGPYADLVRMGTELMQTPDEGPIANVSVASGFVFTDLPKCGLTITVTARNDLNAARRAALTLARRGWAERHRYVPRTMDVAQGVQTALTATEPVILADVADNPGGGGRGSTNWLLAALHEARVPNAALGVFVDPDLAAEAHKLGEGEHFHAVFNRTESTFSRRFEAGATIVRLTDGNDVGRRGIVAGRHFALGPTALLRLDDSGLLVVVGSLRRQLAEPRILEMHGIDIASLHCLVVKSRGHFRAGFDEYFTPDRIHEVDSPGLTTPNLAQVPFERLPRPVWPLDKDAHWEEPAWAADLEAAR